MDREELVLAALSQAGTQELTPVQVQKLFFLLDDQIAEAVDGPHFNHRPYHYGPFDPEVYRAIEAVEALGDARISIPPHYTARRYSLTPSGVDKGQELFEQLNGAAQSYITDAVQFVKDRSFRQLVSSIYKAYPDMKSNSVFYKEGE